MDSHYIKDTLSPLMFDHEYEYKSVSGDSIGDGIDRLHGRHAALPGVAHQTGCRTVAWAWG